MEAFVVLSCRLRYASGHFSACSNFGAVATFLGSAIAVQFTWTRSTRFWKFVKWSVHAIDGHSEIERILKSTEDTPTACVKIGTFCLFVATLTCSEQSLVYSTQAKALPYVVKGDVSGAIAHIRATKGGYEKFCPEAESVFPNPGQASTSISAS